MRAFYSLVRVVTYEQVDRAAWGELVRASRTGTWFQSPEAFDFFASMPDLFAPFVFAIYDERFGIRGVCVGYVTKEKSGLRQYFTRRAIINGGVCLAEDVSNAEVEVLLRTVRAYLADKAIYIETRNFEDYGKWKEAFEITGFVYQKHLNFHVDPRVNKLSDNRKRQIKKAERLSVIGEGVREEDIREWYGILEQLYRTKVRTPLWPVDFFLEAYRQGVGKFLPVKYEGKVIGGSMIVTDGKCVYEWFECGLNGEYKEQYPSVMATWAGIQWAKEHGCVRYDMMGAGEPGVPYGVRDFKAEFGGTMVEHGRWIYVCRPWLYRIGKWGVKMLKRRG